MGQPAVEQRRTATSSVANQNTLAPTPAGENTSFYNNENLLELRRWAGPGAWGRGLENGGGASLGAALMSSEEKSLNVNSKNTVKLM